jgi:hypothetical protein
MALLQRERCSLHTDRNSPQTLQNAMSCASALVASTLRHRSATITSINLQTHGLPAVNNAVLAHGVAWLPCQVGGWHVHRRGLQKLVRCVPISLPVCKSCLIQSNHHRCACHGHCVDPHVKHPLIMPGASSHTTGHTTGCVFCARLKQPWTEMG